MPVRCAEFRGTAEIPAAAAKMRPVQLAEEIVAVLGSDPNAAVRVAVDIAADFPDDRLTAGGAVLDLIGGFLESQEYRARF